MDVQKKKHHQKFNVKHFTLNATVVAILALQTKVGRATTSCPSEIRGAGLASIVCNFDNHPSVTVENNGVVQGIAMNGHDASQILINAGGLISNPSGTGINITGSSLSNGLINNGTIAATSGNGIALNSSAVSGGISNTGTITAGLTGIQVSNSTVNGNISNSGIIFATHTGIGMYGAAISGSITNNGTIAAASGAGINISSGSNINGGITNNGTINSNIYGIEINSSSMNSGISNNGTISAVGTAIKINSSAINGSISNNGTITAGGVDEGIALLNGSTLTGNITNSGVINGYDGILVRDSQVTGDIVNNGTINGVGGGIHIHNVGYVNGDITNNGSIITTDSNSIGIGVRSSSIVSGTISNTGLIHSSGMGIAIDSGTVNQGISNSGTISGNTVGLALLDAATISEGITNSGTIRGGNTGIAVENTSTVSGGISNSGTIQGGINAIFVDPSRSVDINILGQHARVIGNVNAAGSNFNIDSGANFTSEGTFNVNNFNIDSNAVFNMANSITAQNAVNNAGTLSVANAQTITGNYTQNAGGTLQTQITDGTHYGQLNVTGNADFSQSGNINVALTSNSTLHSGEVFTNIIQSDGTLIGPNNGFNITETSFLWDFSASTNANNTNAGPGINLTANINPAAYSVCQGTYCQNAANTIIGQVAAGNTAFDSYNSLSTEAAFTTAAAQATPELTNENTQAVQFVTRSIMDNIPMWNTLHGESTADAASYQPGSVWAKPYGGTMTQYENNSVPGFTATTYGIVIGKDSQLSSNGWLFGAALAAGKDSMFGSADLDGQSIHSDTYQGMLYGVKKLPHNLYFAGQGLVGYGDNNTSRSIPLYSSTATGSYNSWFTNMRAQLGWNYNVNQNLVLTPELDASYLFINQGSYKESGSVMDLSVNSNNNSSLMLGAYGNAAYHITTFDNRQQLSLTGYAGVARDVLENQAQTTATFTAGGPSFSTYGAQTNGFVFRGGAGLTYGSPTKPLSWSLNYNVQTGNNARNGVGSLTVAYKMS